MFSNGYSGVHGTPPVGATEYESHFFSLIAVPYNLRAIIEAKKYSCRSAQKDALQGFWDVEYDPGLDAVNTDAEWEDFARNTTLSIYHLRGTCAMFQLPKAQGVVVDPDFKVRGVESLRIMDASVIPVQLSAHLQTMVYGIGELDAVRIVGAYTWKMRQGTTVYTKRER